MPFRPSDHQPGALLAQGATTRTRTLTDAAGDPIAVEKRLLPRLRDDVAARAQLVVEARILELLDGRGAPRLLGVGHDAEGPWLVMELVALPTLGLLAMARPLHEDRPVVVARVAEQAFAAIAAVHEASDARGPLLVVHGDVSPDNLLAGVGPSVVQFVDFGLAHFRDAPATALGPLRGTPRYVAPEVARGEPATVQSDLFSLGLTLLYAASGEPPRALDSLAALLVNAAEEPVSAYAERATRSLPPHIRDTLLAVVAFEPRDRPASAREAWHGGSW